MALMRGPETINSIPLSPRTQFLLFAPTWMLFPHWRRQVMEQPIAYISPGLGILRSELRT
jgi:hypothetical protein